MSDFSEALKTEIQNSNKTLIYLSEASDLTVDYISKMRQGKRLPHDENKVRALIESLQCPEKTAQMLFHYYKLERLGHTQWSCFCEIQKLLKQELSFQTEFLTNLEMPPAKLPQVTMLSNKTEILLFVETLARYIVQKKQVIKVISKTANDFLLHKLIPSLAHENISMEHIFPMMQNASPECSLHNLKLLNQIFPLLQASRRYSPFYYYEYSSDHQTLNSDFMDLYSFWILTEEYVLAINTSFDCGLIIQDPGQIRQVFCTFNKLKTQTKPLVRWYDDPLSWMSHIEKVQKTGHTVHNFYLEYGPCLLMVLDDDLLQQHIMIPKTSLGLVHTLIHTRQQTYGNENVVHFFTLAGVREFLETGRLGNIPEELYSPFDLTERIRLLQKFISIMKKRQTFYVLNEQLMPIASDISIYASSSVCNEITLYHSRGTRSYCSIYESGIAEKLNQFCEFIQDSDFILPFDEGIIAVQNILREFS